jgi:tetratricopeptide (TPR) repeat protein
MKPASRVATLLVLLLAGFAAAPVALHAQDPCPLASGPDAEAGWAAYTAGDMDLARARFDAAIARCPDDPYARTGIGYVLLRAGDVTSAAEVWRGVVASQPDNVDALSGLGLAAWRSGDLDEVRARFARVLELVPDHATALDYMARASGTTGPRGSDPANDAWVEGNSALAGELYEARLATDPTDGVALHRLALLRAWSEDYDGAQELFERLLAIEPTNLDARVGRARVWVWAGETDRALDELAEVLQVNPDHPDALEMRALFEAWAGRYEESLASYDELLAISADNGAARRQQAQVLSWASRFDASRAVYDSLLASNPDDIESRLGLARALAFSDDLSGAITEYDRVLAQDSGNIRALQGKGRALGWAGRLVEGEEVYHRAVVADVTNAASLVGLAQILRWQDRNAAALQVLQGAEAIAPTDGDVREQLRAVRLALDPVAQPSVIWEDDSDGNRMLTTSLSAGWHPVPRVGVRADAYWRHLEAGGLSRSAMGVTVTASYQLEPGWTLSVGGGGNETDGAGPSGYAAYQVGLTSPARHPATMGLTLVSSGLDATAALAEIGVKTTAATITGRWTPAPAWRVDAAGGWARFAGTQDNDRTSGFLSISRRVARIFSLGGSFRAFSFEQDLADGYFDPDFYGIVELTARWLHQPRRWSLLVELAPGAQRVGSSGDLGATLRTSGRIGYRIAPGREVSLSAGYSTTGLQSFASGASDYRYTALILGVSWVF